MWERVALPSFARSMVPTPHSGVEMGGPAADAELQTAADQQPPKAPPKGSALDDSEP